MARAAKNRSSQGSKFFKGSFTLPPITDDVREAGQKEATWLFEISAKERPYGRMIFAFNHVNSAFVGRRDFHLRIRHGLSRKASPLRYSFWDAPWWGASSDWHARSKRKCRTTPLIDRLLPPFLTSLLPSFYTVNSPLFPSVLFYFLSFFFFIHRILNTAVNRAFLCWTITGPRRLIKWLE